MTFGSYNNQIINFNYLLNEAQFKGSTLFTVIFAVGFIVGCISCSVFWLRASVSLMRAERKIKQLELQIKQNVNNPINTLSNPPKT